MGKLMTIEELCEVSGGTRMSIYSAIKNEKLKSKKIGVQWFIDSDDFLKYLENRWNRNFSKYKGAPLYDRSKGECSPREAADFLGLPSNSIYHYCHKGRIPYKKKGGAFVLNREDVMMFKKELYPDPKRIGVDFKY